MAEHDDAATFRALFDDVMDDAPTPPTVSEIETARTRPDDHTTTRFWGAAVAAGLVAAAAIAVVAIPNASNDTLRTDGVAGPPDTAPLIVDPTITDTDTDADATEDDEENVTTTEATGPLPAFGEETVVAVASRAGVTVASVEGEPVQVIDGPADSAHATDDGRIVALQPPLAAEGGPGQIVMWDPATDDLVPLDVPNPTGGALRLYDVATVDGVVTILYDHGPAECDVEADECDVALRTFEPDTGQSTELLSLNGARNSWTTLSLADTGIIVGESVGADGTSFHSSLAGPEVAAPMPTADGLGLSPSPAGCADCPRAYTIDRTGRFVAWRQGSDLVVVDLEDPSQRAIAPSIVPEQDPSQAVVLPAIDRIALDGTRVTNGVVAFRSVDGVGSVIVDIAAETISPVVTGTASVG